MIISNDGWQTNSRRILLCVLLVFVPALFSSACGDEAPEREYSLPRKLCGVPVKTKLLVPFLPGGKKTSQKERMEADDVEGLSCDLRVDGRTAVSVNSAWNTKEASPSDADDAALIEHPSPKKHLRALQDGSYITGDRVSAAAVPCLNPKARMSLPAKNGKPRTGPAKSFTFSVEVFKGPEDDKESHKAMARFMGPFSEALVKTLPCQGA